MQCVCQTICVYNTATVYYDISSRYDYYICKDDTETLCVSNYDPQSNRQVILSSRVVIVQHLEPTN